MAKNLEERYSLIPIEEEIISEFLEKDSIASRLTEIFSRESVRNFLKLQTSRFVKFLVDLQRKHNIEITGDLRDALSFSVIYDNLTLGCISEGVSNAMMNGTTIEEEVLSYLTEENVTSAIEELVQFQIDTVEENILSLIPEKKTNVSVTATLIQ